jgi:hypothetical protein
MKRRTFLINSIILTAGSAAVKNIAAGMASPPNTFRLFPYGSVQFVDPRITTPISFAHITDLHLTPEVAGEAQEPYRGAIEWWDRTFNRPHQVLPKLLEEIKAAEVDFVFFGGDNIDCYQPQMADRLGALARDLGLKAYFQGGNHDWESLPIRYVTHQFDASLRSKNLEALCRHWNMPAPYYSYELKGVRFIVLDPPYMKQGPSWAGKFDDEQTNWFLRELNYNGPIIVFHHIPFVRPTLEFRLRALWNGSLACVAEDENGLRVARAIERSPNVLGTFTGHAHIRSEDAMGDTCQFMTAPASDAQWRYVKISNTPPPKSLRAAGTPDVHLPA